MDRVGSNVMVVESSRRVRYCEGILRLLGLFLTLIAAIVTVVDNETKTIPLNPFVSNAIAFSYAAASLVASVAVRSSKDKSAIVLVILDIAMMGLPFSTNGVGIAVSIIGQDGNSHLQWKEVCHLIGCFSHQMTTTIIFLLVGSLVLPWLGAVATLNLHKKSR